MSPLTGLELLELVDLIKHCTNNGYSQANDVSDPLSLALDLSASLSKRTNSGVGVGVGVGVAVYDGGQHP